MKKLLYVYILIIIIVSDTNCSIFPGNNTPSIDTIKNLTELKSVAVFKTDHDYYKVHLDTVTATNEREPKEIGLVALNCNLNTFQGVTRKQAKTSFVDSTVIRYITLNSLLASLPSDSSMIHHSPGINSRSARVAEEMKTVNVTPVYLVAIKREADEDYHMIISNDSTRKGPFMTTEVSGLPDSTSASFITLLQARKTVENMFGVLCDSLYIIFDTPMRISITGSLFYDIDHAPGTVGPFHYRPTTAWEIHPVTSVDFDPPLTKESNK